jgi:hypothetical protein
MVDSVIKPSKKPNKKPKKKEFSTMYKRNSLKKLPLEVRVGSFILSYCEERVFELINFEEGIVYHLYRSSIYLGYGFSFINLFFTERGVRYLGKTKKTRRLLLPRVQDASRFVKVARGRILECLIRNKPEGMGFYFLTLRRDEDIKAYLSRYFYKNSCYRYISFKEYNGRNRGTFLHQHCIVVLPEELKDHITAGYKKLSYIQESNLGKVVNYCLKSSNNKSIKPSRNLCIPKLIRLDRPTLKSMESVIFSASPSSFSYVNYTNRCGDSCVRVSVKIDGGLEAPGYRLKMKKKINY